MSFLQISALVLGVVAFAAFAKFFLLPWAPPLYARYRGWVERTASGVK